MTNIQKMIQGEYQFHEALIIKEYGLENSQ